MRSDIGDAKRHGETVAPAARDWTMQKERGCLAALRVMTWIARVCGRRLSRLVLHPITFYYLLTAGAARRASHLYLTRVLGRAPRWREAYAHLHAFASVLLDRVYFLLGRVDAFDVRIVTDDYLVLPREVRSGGVFLMGAHVGSFEAVRMLSRRHSEPLKPVLLMYEENARKIGALMSAINPAAQQEIVALGNLSAMLTVKERLAEGALIGILADRTLGQEKTRTLPFLGAPAQFALGPFRMAAMMRRPVLLMTGLYRGGRRYDIHLERIADFGQAPQDAPRDIEAEIDAAMRRYVARLEHHVRSAPYNWFNFYDFWQEEAHERSA